MGIATSDIKENVQEATRLFQLQKEHHWQLGKSTLRERRSQLKLLQVTLLKYRKEIQEALYKDFKKPAQETDITELLPSIQEIKHVRANLKYWMRDRKVETPLSLLGSKSWVRHEPKGVTLIISPWNYPLYLTISPLLSAIAAGCTAILKPSEITPHCSALMKKIIGEVFPEKQVALLEGGVATSSALLALPFNHIFFTGAPSIGKIVMSAAAKHLASVTLELGGKSPTIVDETANIDKSGMRIAWGKWMNGGQTCIAPDYILVQEQVAEKLKAAIIKYTKKLYGNPEASKDLARSVNQRHFQRVQGYLQEAVSNGAKVVYGGEINAEDDYLAPTLVEQVPENSVLMNEEIFGNLLPIKTYKTLEEAVAYVQQKETPLALYIFSGRKKNINYILENTKAGGTSINNSTLHILNANLPFGGHNNSGIGKSHGHEGYLEFSNARGIYKQVLPISAGDLLMPPFGSKFKNWLVDFTMKWL